MNKKKLLVIAILSLIVIPLKTEGAADAYYSSNGRRQAKIKLTSSSHIDNFGVTCLPDFGGGIENEQAGIGACVGQTAQYSASTFEVDMGAENGSKYWGYCVDPGYAFGGGSQTATCSQRYDGNLKYLADAAGTSHKDNSDDGKVYELALRLLAMEAGYSNSSADKEVGRGLNQAITYLEQTRAAYDQAAQACGTTREEINNRGEGSYYDETLVCVHEENKRILEERGWNNINIRSFISGEAGVIFTRAYWLLREIKDGKYTFGAKGGTDKPSFELDIDNVECSGTTGLRVPIKSRRVSDENVHWTTVGNVHTLFGDIKDFVDHLYIPLQASSEFNCDESGASFMIHASYKGGEDGDMYVCTPDSGNQQSILVYTGSSSVVPGTAKDGEAESSNNWTIPIPSCARDLLQNCTGCSHDPVEVKTKGGSQNCCSAGGAGGTVQDQANGKFDINEIFGKNEELNLEHQKVKCQAMTTTKAPDFNASNAESDTKTMQKYCTMYCMETSSAHVPGPVEVTSGRYFKLPISTEMSVSERRDCRIQIKFDHFLEDYKKTIDKEVDAFNNYQRAASVWAMYDKLDELYVRNTPLTHRSIQYSCVRDDLVCEHCEPGEPDPDDPDSEPEDECDTYTISGDSTTAYSDLEYKIVPYKNIRPSDYKYDIVYLDADYGAGNQNSKFLIKKQKTETPEFSKGPKTAFWAVEVKNDKSAVSAVERSNRAECNPGDSGGSKSFRCEVADNFFNTIMEATYNSFDYDMNGYKRRMNEGKSKLQSATNDAKKLEESMYECENYFTEGDGAKVGNHYKINITAGLSYDLVYNKDNGEVTAMTQSGKIISSCGMGVGEADSRAYADLWGRAHEVKMLDFTNKLDMDFKRDRGAWEIFLDDERKIDKSFKVSGTYSGGCSFNDAANTYNTLFAGGLASPVLTPNENFTGHSKVYHAPLTNYTGRMEIRYSMGGFGSQVMRNFDSQFLAGSTCSGMSGAGTGSPFSCYYDARQKLVTTGRCRDGKVVSTKNYMYNCGPYCAGNDCDKIHNFNFKTVDPSLLFPNGTQNGRYAKNWVLTKEGKITQYAIEHEDTFNPSNLTYSFSFTSNDLNLIKKYNEKQIGGGGYSDFRLTCKCGSNSDGRTNGNEVCHECISEFLTNLYNKKVVYNNVGHNLTMDKVWGNDNLTLNQVRYNGYNHWSRDTVVENPRTGS